MGQLGLSVVRLVLLLVQATSDVAIGQRQHIHLFQATQAVHGFQDPLQPGDHQHSHQQFTQQQQVDRFGRPALVPGPAVDLVALNRRRFELGHHHHHHDFHGDGSRGLTAANEELRRAEFIESQVAAIPERILEHLPDELTRQLFESISADPSLVLAPAPGAADEAEAANSSEDPDGATIERLTKSCLTVHASSSSAEQLNVTFHLFTRKNPRLPLVLRPQVSRNELLNGRWSPFDAAKPVKWITHGFHTNLDKSEWMLEAKDKILAHEDANVLLTDWRRGASPALAFYPKAAANAHVVAKMIAKILWRLRDDIDFAQIHLIGHSLGAHIMGFVGSTFTEDYLSQQQQQLASAGAGAGAAADSLLGQPSGAQLIGRITACDPALPCFGPSSSAPNSRLNAPQQQQQQQVGTSSSPLEADKQLRTAATANAYADWTPTMWTHLRPDSAVIVEVMHSNPGVMGYADPLGDFDFYPNGHDRQPGCGSPSSSGGHVRAKRQSSSFSATFDKLVKPIKDFFSGYTCSHHRSVEYMVESMYYEHSMRHHQQQQQQQWRSDPSQQQPAQVCQMVGYRCLDYQSFKKGFCFRCQDEHDCRAFLMSVDSLAAGSNTESGYNPTLSSQYLNQSPLSTSFASSSSSPGKPLARSMALAKFNNRPGISTKLNSNDQRPMKRVLPTFNHYQQNYKPLTRSQYYFDTKHSRDFCLNHYHLLIKYRWFRIRDSLALESFKLMGTLGSITQQAWPQDDQQQQQQQQTDSNAFHRFTYQSYTMLLTHPSFLGQIESLMIFGDKLKPALIEFIDVSFLSNLDPNIRASGSARLCRSTSPISPSSSKHLSIMMANDNISPKTPITLFVRCSSSMVR